MSERMGYAIDDTRWPLVTARATKFLEDPVAVEASYRKLERILARDQHFVLLFDMRGASSTSERRRKFREWGQAHVEPLTRLIVAGAVVAASSLERGFVTASLWVVTPPWPMRVFAESGEAEEWLVSEFARRKP